MNGARTILPVDSEHSAIFQALQAGRHEEVRRVVLTASGGPFRELSLEQLKQVTVDDALAHPTWEMGPKITVDSATMMNKALEIIESRWLFDLTADQIEVVIHPQSIVHSFVEFVDGSVDRPNGTTRHEAAHSVRPRIPAPTKLALPSDWTGGSDGDWNSSRPIPSVVRPCSLGYDCARRGGTSGAVLNAANEAAVEAFLQGELHFTEIVPACRKVLGYAQFRSRTHARTARRARSLGPSGGSTLGMHLIAMIDLVSPSGRWIGMVLKVARRPRRVIFVHELGHFLVAKVLRRQNRKVHDRLRHRRLQIELAPRRNPVRNRHSAAGRLRENVRPG